MPAQLSDHDKEYFNKPSANTAAISAHKSEDSEVAKLTG